MCAWTKRGLVFATARDGAGGWMRHSALTPTPHRLDGERIRVYAGFRDEAGVSRIGYVDVLADDPATVLDFSREPVLDIGRGGCFDDSGMILGDLIDAPDGLLMFYVGFQRVAHAKFLAFTGLARSRDGGRHFERVQDTPILDRAPGRSTIAAVHSVLRENGRWRLWYAAGDDWEYIDGRPFPRYHIRCVETEDLHSMPRRDRDCLRPRGDEYRIGRPRVHRVEGEYTMHFTWGDRAGGYLPGMARSQDGVHWTRCDEDFDLPLSTQGWDSRSICYPAPIRQRDRWLLFYNGNDMGVDGFGVAQADCAGLHRSKTAAHAFG
ncbi:MAG: hypothetical protein ACREPP_10940 [Rhodanobacteraceae bacterium]